VSGIQPTHQPAHLWLTSFVRTGSTRPRSGPGAPRTQPALVSTGDPCGNVASDSIVNLLITQQPYGLEITRHGTDRDVASLLAELTLDSCSLSFLPSVPAACPGNSGRLNAA
jgi:hypothetical protein